MRLYNCNVGIATPILLAEIAGLCAGRHFPLVLYSIAVNDNALDVGFDWAAYLALQAFGNLESDSVLRYTARLVS